ncbi:hypothetical protein NHX12_030872 [Muraenolepis orangiensis]|uniref:G-protein coupled receptors family 1 profile domain-containing protein n=1 Tax=Muraenolepis orangiensis TaxID=630683 RepID=A0A9Q0EB22_9TELE|nr:hypothetical protein NHX12_030872 [Muraenolepis orangiensis]
MANSTSTSMESSGWKNTSERTPLNDGNFDNTSFSCDHPTVLEYRYFAVLWGSLVTVTGTLGNLMTILAFATDRRLRTRFNVLIVNLALADLLYCTIVQPVSVDSYLHLRWRGGQLWCQTSGLLLMLSNSVSIITLCLIATGRYLLVERRATFRRVFSTRGLLLLVPSTWVLAGASFAPLWSVFVFVPEVCTCSFDRMQGRPYTTILLIFYFFFGLCCVGVFYLLIYKRVRVAAGALVRYRPSHRHSARMNHSGAESGAASTCISEMSNSHELLGDQVDVTWEKAPGELEPSRSVLGSHAAGASFRGGLPSNTLNAVPLPTPPAASPAAPAPGAPQGSGEFKKVTRMCCTVFACFTLCFAPFLLLSAADTGGRAPRLLHMVCANLTWLNSCINPVLYAVINPLFRQSYRLLLSRAAAPLAFLWRR